MDRYEREIIQIGEIRLDADKVGPFGLNDLGITDIEIEGVIGNSCFLAMQEDSKNSVMMRLAAICTNNFESKTTYSNNLSSKLENTHKREIFRQFYKVVVEWWNHEHVRIPPLFTVARLIYYSPTTRNLGVNLRSS
ncbi:MAG: hypothetical protein F4W92_03830 [Gammaproteobacteria bacterium]|nr:hypothetical protein [Gammaproteobacteria bacterium]